MCVLLCTCVLTEPVMFTYIRTTDDAVDLAVFFSAGLVIEEGEEGCGKEREREGLK